MDSREGFGYCVVFGTQRHKAVEGIQRSWLLANPCKQERYGEGTMHNDSGEF